MAKSGMSRAGGGINSRVVKSSASGRKVEPKSRGISPAGVSQIGSAMGNHSMDNAKVLRGAVEPIVSGPGYNLAKGANVNAKPTLYGNCGTQGTQGPVAPGIPMKRTDILSGFGPDSPIVSGRK